MRFGVGAGLALALVAFAAADKKLPLEQSSNELVEISATLLDKDQVRQEVGADLAGMVVVRVRVRPLSEKAVKIDRDDFTLLSTNDGQHTTPYAPSQIAGNSTLVVTPEGTRGSMAGRSNGPIWGGLGGGMDVRSRCPGMAAASAIARGLSRIRPPSKTTIRPKMPNPTTRC